MPNPSPYRRQVLDHLGLVAGMFDDLGLGDVIDQATRQNPEMRDLTVGEAVKAMVLNGLGLINQARYLVSRFFQHQPTYRLMSPRVTPEPLNDDALGRTLDTLYAYGVTALYSLMAVSAAKRLGLCPTDTPLDTTRFPVDGRDNRDEEPEGQVVHITKGSRRDHRPDRNQVMVELLVEHQAGIPILMPPLSGNRSDPQTFGHVIRAHLEPLHTTSGAPSLVADRALSREDNLDKLAQTAITWITRVPATWSEAQAALAHADPQALAALQEGDRAHELTSTYGGVARRWVRIDSEPRQAPAPRTVAKQRRQQHDKAVNAFKTLCRTALACAAEARQALSAFERRGQATGLPTSTVRAQPRDGQRGRPGRDAPPEQVVYQIAGAVASSIPARQARVHQPSGCILATNELDETPLPPPEGLPGYKGQGQAERGFRCLKDPQCFASSLYLKKPERIMALLLVMTVCLLVDAALEYRIRQALKDHEAPFPDQKGQRMHHPTARWVFHYVGGIHVLCQAGQWPMVLNLTEEHQHWLRLRGPPYMRLYDVRNSSKSSGRCGMSAL
jgi:transposase